MESWRLSPCKSKPPAPNNGTTGPNGARIRERWRRRHATFLENASPPWWGRGLILNEDIRNQYEAYLPIRELLRDLALLLTPILPHSSWLPTVLKKPDAFASVPDLWAILPDGLAGVVSWSDAQLWPLACALASPAKFGGAVGRYPEQISFLTQWLAKRSGTSVTVIDFGCSTGQQTYEVAALLRDHDCAGLTLGVTLEPIEAYLARMSIPRSLPLASASEKPKDSRLQIEFIAGDIAAFAVSRPADVVLCNGLLGGPALFRDMDLVAVWRTLSRVLKPRGLLIVGSRFHLGHEPYQKRFLDMGKHWATVVAEYNGSWFLTTTESSQPKIQF